MAASFLLRRHLLLPTFAIPVMLLVIPPLIIAILTVLASTSATVGSGRRQQYGNISSISLPTIGITSAIILFSTVALSAIGRSAIAKHAPNEQAKQRALAQSTVALPFWSLVLSIGVIRTIIWYYTLAISVEGMVSRGGWMNWIGGILSTLIFWTVRIAGACVGPALAWMVLAILVVCRYAGIFCPIVRCSSTPLRTNPFDATLQRIGRNFTSKTGFLDMIADGLDKLSTPSKPMPANIVGNSATLLGKDGRMPGSRQGMQSTSTQTAFMTGRKNRSMESMALLPGSNISTDGFGSVFRNYLLASSHARYSRPGLLSILVQVLINAIGGHVFTRTFILPHVAQFWGNDNDATAAIIGLSCIFVPVFEFFSSVNESELHFGHYSSVEFGGSSREFHLQPVILALAKDVIHRGKRSILSVTVLSPVLATVAIVMWAHLGPLLLNSYGSLVVPIASSSLSYSAILQAVVVSYLSVAGIVFTLAIQDLLTRWAVCAPGMDVEVLMFEMALTKPKSGGKFLAEDLITQSILMGDGMTVNNVLSPPGGTQPRQSLAFKNRQEDEIDRNENATTLFAQWIQHSSTSCSGNLSDDILRMCLLESLGGGGSANPAATSQSHPFFFGESRHSAAIRKRLDLSAATASPGRQPIVIPIVRALCAFSGGVGDAMSRVYQETTDKDTRKPFRKNNSAELWKLPPGSLNAVEFAIIGATRLVVMNSVIIDKHGRVAVNASKRHDWLSLLLPCVLQSAYKVRCGIHEYAKATASMYEVDLATYAKSSDMGDDGLGCFIAAKCPELFPILSACNNCARMTTKTLVESGDRSLENVLLRKKGGMQQWLVGLNCEKESVTQTPTN